MGTVQASVWLSRRSGFHRSVWLPRTGSGNSERCGYGKPLTVGHGGLEVNALKIRVPWKVSKQEAQMMETRGLFSVPYAE